MRLQTSFLLPTLGILSLTACVEVSEPVSGGNEAVARSNCVNSVNSTIGASGSTISDVTVLEDGYSFLVTVPGAEQPWVCEADFAGNVGEVFYLGEG